MKKIINKIKKKIIECFLHEIKFELIKQNFEKEMLIINNKNILEYRKDNNPQIIVSLTSYSKRINQVHLVIESIFKQTLIPNKIVLWLSRDEFDDDTIPLVLKNMKKIGLEINYCEDIKSYKKIIPALLKYPDDIIITIDDDIIYNYDLIENLIKIYKKSPVDTVVCSRAHSYKLKNKYEFAPYRKWELETKENKNLFLTSGAGTLFPPNSFDQEFFNINKIMELSPLADDIWINAMLIKNNKELILVEQEEEYTKKHYIIKTNQDIALSKINFDKNKNDIQLKRVFDYYNLWEKLRGENKCLASF